MPNKGGRGVVSPIDRMSGMANQVLREPAAGYRVAV